MYADRFMGWLEVDYLHNGASSGRLMSHFCRFFACWRAPEELLTTVETTLLVRCAGSAGAEGSKLTYPQPTSLNPISVSIIGPDSSLDTDRLLIALLQYLSTPLGNIDKSPAKLATGRQFHDGVPMARQNH